MGGDQLELLHRCHEFCSRGSMGALRELLDEHVDQRQYLIHTPGNLGNTALHWASSAGHEDIVAFLLKKKVDISPFNDINDTPLHLAASKGHVEAVVHLIGSGADVTITNRDGKIPCDLAKDTEVKQMLTASHWTV